MAGTNRQPDLQPRTGWDYAARPTQQADAKSAAVQNPEPTERVQDIDEVDELIAARLVAFDDPELDELDIYSVTYKVWICKIENYRKGGGRIPCELPVVTLTAELRRNAAANVSFDAAKIWPGWDCILNYVFKHPELIGE